MIVSGAAAIDTKGMIVRETSIDEQILEDDEEGFIDLID